MRRGTQPSSLASAVQAGAAGQAGGGKKVSSTLAEIQRLQTQREERRRAAEQFKTDRAAEDARNRENGNPGDVDFQRMIRAFRTDSSQMPQPEPHLRNEDKICICVRKRPISQKEVKRNDHDSITCSNPVVVVHDCKLKVDGISKYLDNTSFEVDHAFHEDCSTEDVYQYTVQPLVGFVASGGRATVFAYGQTGSGKTYTMQGIQSLVVQDLFDMLNSEDDHAQTRVFVSYFEIYGGRCQDLLNNRQRLNVREDGSGEVIVGDLEELEADGPDALQSIVDTGNRNRTTHATESNDESSRSHAICQIALRVGERQVGRLSLIDLAGSERGADTKSHNRQRRLEGAEINKSLLALKECIWALDSNSSHVPYRASKLTLVLKDSFTRETSRTVMIANISPAASSADHTLNTLRYADRIKEQTVGGQAAANRAANNKSPVPAPAPLSTAVKAAVQPPKVPQLAAEPKAVGKALSVVGAQAKLTVERKENCDNKGEVDDLDDADTAEHIFEEEEALLNLHMNIIQENAELLTEEGRLLQQIQCDDSDIDGYAARLETILRRKQSLIEVLQQKLSGFRQLLQVEENVFRSTMT
jgi:kinesin family protein 2/24